MAIIQKIRDKYAKLAGGVIAVSLIAFVLNDAFSGGGGGIFGNDTSIAKVNGDAIDPLELEKRDREYITVYTATNREQPLTDDIKIQIKEQALRDLVTEKLIDKQLKKLGITISDKEKNELIYGSNPSPMVQMYPYFQNPETGQFELTRIKEFENQLRNPGPDADPNMIQREKENWDNFKNFVQVQYKFQKFNGLIGASAYSPKFLIDYKLSQQGEMASIQTVRVPAAIISDGEVTVSDADIQAYLKKHKKTYQNTQESRGVDYVAFDVLPSKEDSLALYNTLENVKEEMIATSAADIENFVTKNSDNGYREFYYNKKNFKDEVAETILSLPVGNIYGPYVDGSSYVMVKSLDHKTLPDSVKAQHILIQPSQQLTDSAAKLEADSIELAIRAGASFDSLAAIHSIDNQNNKNGGDLGYFTYGSMVPEFNDFVFFGKTGDMKVVKTNFGYHVVKINDQKNFQPMIKLAILVKNIYPSDNTETDIYTKATEFASKYKKDAASFEAGIKAMNLQKRQATNIHVQDFNIQGLGPAREIVRWIYDAKSNQVSEVLKISQPNDRYIIALLNNIQPVGELALNDANKPEVENMIRNEKKLEKIVEKYKSANSLEAIAQGSGQQVQTADSFTFNTAYLNNIGYNPKVLGYAFNKDAKVGALSTGLKTGDAVSYVVITSKNKIEINPNEAAVYQQQQKSESQQYKQMLSGQIQDLLKKSAKIKYNNDNIY